MEPHTEAKISKRCVFYASGFDVRGVKFYHNLYKTESAKQAQLLNARIEVSERSNSGNFSKWRINYTSADAGECETSYHFLRWDDVVRKSWPRGNLGLLVSGFHVYRDIFRQHMLFRTMGSPYFMFTIAYSLFLFLGSIVGGIACALLFSRFGVIPQIAVAALVTVGLLKFSKGLNAYWLIAIYSFYQHHAQQTNQAYDACIESFVDHIYQSMTIEQADEFLLVGHSVGCVMACSVYARLAQKYPDIEPKLSLLKLVTVAHCMPIFSFMSDAQQFREELTQLANRDMVWLNIASPLDGICAYHFDPFVGVCTKQNVNYASISPHYWKMLNRKRFLRLLSNKYLAHFQYLMAGSRRSSFDYFSLTAGTENLESWFKLSAPEQHQSKR